MGTKNKAQAPSKPRSSLLYFPLLLASMFKGAGNSRIEGSATLRGMAGVSMGNPEFHPKRKKDKAAYRAAHPELLRTRKRRRMQNKYNGKSKW